MEKASPNNRTIFDKISKNTITSYLLDYVTEEYESIISCPPVKYCNQSDSYSNNKRSRSNSNDYTYTRYKSTRTEINSISGLPSPPLSSPESKLGKYSQVPAEIRPLTPPLIDRAIPLRSYIEYVVQKSRIDTGTLLTSLSYARRLRSKLSSTSKGMECTHHRIFIATLIIATKYIHDSALKNKYWVGYAQMFSASEINLMEKQLLQLLDYNLEIKPNDYDTIADDVAQLYSLHDCSSKQDVSAYSFQMNQNNTTNDTLLNRLKSSTSILSNL